jgi:hypothetical protein
MKLATSRTMKRVKTLFSWTICDSGWMNLRFGRLIVTSRFQASDDIPSMGEPETRFWGTKPDAGQLDGA